jgi:hypothetical protein
VPRDKKDVEAGLLGKGFEGTGAEHHKYVVYRSVGGKKAMAKTKTSHGSGKDLSDDLLGKMAKQCGLTKANFLRLVDCPMQRPEYEQLLKSVGKL